MVLLNGRVVKLCLYSNVMKIQHLNFSSKLKFLVYVVIKDYLNISMEDLHIKSDEQ
jgi:hypothetical protein